MTVICARSKYAPNSQLLIVIGILRRVRNAGNLSNQYSSIPSELKFEAVRTK